MAIKQEIEKLIRNAIAELGEGQEILLEHPENPEHGDYATSVAFALAKQVGQNPNDIAGKLAVAIDNQQSAMLDKVEAVGGFVNLYLSKETLGRQLAEVLKQKEKFGRNETLKNKKVMVEFTDPNPFKEFHVGHLYSNAVGEALSRVFEAAGAKVQRVNYQGDVGMHVAKAIWGMQKLNADPGSIQALGKAYAEGARAYEDSVGAKEEINALNKVMYDKSDTAVNKLYDAGRATSLRYFEQMYKRLGTKFERYYFESEAAKAGIAIVEQGLQDGVFEKSQGAVIFPGEKYGLHNRVFINSASLPTYEAKELGLALTKFKDFTYDVSIIVTGSEIKEYFKVLLRAMEKVFPGLAAKTTHVTHGMVRLPEGKMSSRTGNVLTAEWLLDNAKGRASTLAEASTERLSEKEQEEVAEKVAVAAVKYSLLRVGVGKDIIFDIEKSLSLEGDSGPYLLYTYARCQSILRKGDYDKSMLLRSSILLLEISTEELDILRTTYKFSEVVQEAAEKYAPNLICTYAFDLAQKYNAFYNTNPVLKADTKEQQQFRLQLTAATAQLLANSLHLLGIQALEKM